MRSISSIRMSRRTSTALRVAVSIGLLGFAASTGFQGLGPSTAEAAGPSGGVLPPAPNVLLLVDRSGSMSRTSMGNLPKCQRGVDSRTIAPPPGDTINMDRWGQILEGLTGHVQPFYSCDAVDRTSTAFQQEFNINTHDVPDYGYALPYNRPLSHADVTDTNTCAITPGFLPGASFGLGHTIKGDNTPGSTRQYANGWDPDRRDPNVFGTSKGSIVDRLYSSVLGVNNFNYGVAGVGCTFDQYADGQLDIARKFIRFSLMTTDGDPSDYKPPTASNYGVTGGNVPWSNLTTGGGTSVSSSLPVLGEWSYLPQFMPHDTGATGYPHAKLPSCATDTPFAVGARHLSAPPWEGRHVPFPLQDGPDDSNLDQIERVLLASRPYGASPLDGLMYDAADYLWRQDDYGPWSAGTSQSDTYVQAGCRKQYVILISDGASNLGLHPACDAVGGTCPFPTPTASAKALWDGAALGPLAAPPSNAQIETFVIGFSARGTAVSPPAEPGWFSGLPPGPPTTCSAAMNGAGGFSLFAGLCAANTPQPVGSMAEACCTLNDIAVAGSGGQSGVPAASQVGAFFVDSEAEFSLAMGKILGTISASTTSRTTPTYSSTFATRDSTYTVGSNANASFVSTLTPQPGGLWTGDIIRKRNVCNGGAPTPLLPIPANDDLFEANTKAESPPQRWFFTAIPAARAGKYDATVTLRPYDSHTDQLTNGANVAESRTKDHKVTGSSMTAVVAGGPIDPDLLAVTATTCGSINVGTHVPPVTLKHLPNPVDCGNAIWAYMSGWHGPVPLGVGDDYGLRCQNPGGAGIYNLGCHPLGGIFHSEPTVMPPPPGFISDEGYRAFAASYSKRPSVLYVETMDGLLHAFDATNDTLGGAYVNELFSFIPPAVLPNLKTNFPTGAATLLDSTPAVKDVVWERQKTDVGSAAATRWHTMLVAGEPGGYFALEVSDPLPAKINVTEPGAGATYGPYIPGTNNGTGAAGAYPAQPSVPGVSPESDYDNNVAGRPIGPHFMWQLTTADALPVGMEQGSIGGTSHATNARQASLFGAVPSKPAITTLYYREPAGAPREVGVAILPGGMPATPPSPAIQCARRGGTTTTTTVDSGGIPYPIRANVRNWDDCNGAAIGTTAVPSRQVTIVRLDNGEIVRVFARNTGAKPQDIPTAIPFSAAGRVTNVPLDSPMSGTPVVYPNDVGAVAQRFYIGDADGTLWRFDVSDKDPANWNGRIFYDTQNSKVNGNATSPGLDGQPLVLEPAITQDAQGHAVIIIATGDQDHVTRPKPTSLGAPPPDNYIVSLTELPDPGGSGTGYYKSYLNWVYGFGAIARNHPGERVTGPFSVFNNVVYFATYWPSDESGTGTACLVGGSPNPATLFAFDYVGASTPTAPLQPVPGFPTNLAAVTDSNGKAVTYVPGVSIQAGLQCATAGPPAGSPFGSYSALSFTSATPTFSLAAMTSSGGTIGGAGAAGANALPSISTPSVSRIDSWAAIVE
jgi:type IV pilus assembly protein PilY1